jgi:hypothetical protein
MTGHPKTATDMSVKGHGATAGAAVRPIMLLVVGPHRSGTSTVARALECLGAVNSTNLMPPSHTHPRGYFEDNDIYLFNDRVLLPALGRTWSSISSVDWRALRDDQRSLLEAQALDILRRNYPPSQRLCVLKEPRIGALLPFWLPSLHNAGFDIKMVGAVRHPYNVARSLQSRDGFSLAHGSMVYLKTWLGVLAQAERVPLGFISFEGLLENTIGSLRRVAVQLGISPPEDFAERVNEFISLFLDQSLYHHREDACAVQTKPSLPRIVDDFHGALLAATVSKDHRDYADVLPSALIWIESVEPFLQEFDLMFEEKRKTQSEATYQDLALAERDVRIASLSQEVESLSKAIRELRGTTSWKVTAPMRWARTKFMTLPTLRGRP